MTNNINTKLTSVTCTGTHITGKKLKVALTGNWLLDIGFTIGSSIKVVPKTEGMDFVLVDDDSSVTKEEKLIHVIQISYKERGSFPAVMTSGNFINSCGLSFGDTCVVKYSYGKIQIRKVDLAKFGFSDNEATRICSFNIAVLEYGEMQTRLSEKWLSSYGFENEAVILATADGGSITFELKDKEIEPYEELVKMVRVKKLTLIQVRSGGKGNPYIAIHNRLLTKSGFTINDIFAVKSTYGNIKLCKLDVSDMF